MRLTCRILFVAIAALAVLAGSAAAAQAAENVPNRVSLESMPGGLFGYVTSPQASCAQGRQVAIYRQAGSTRDPALDERVARAVAKRNSSGYHMWLSKLPGGSGPFYAEATVKADCRPAMSKPLTIRRNAADEPPVCSSSASANEQVCRFPRRMYLNIAYGDTIGLPCPSFSAGSGDCHGTAISGPWSNPDPPEEWRTGFAPHGHFDWWGGGGSREVRWYVIPDGGYLYGNVPGPGSPNWTISDAGILDDGHAPPPEKGVHWYTPDVSGKGAGDPGGPFYIDFENSWWGADIYIWGYLFRKP